MNLAFQIKFKEIDFFRNKQRLVLLFSLLSRFLTPRLLVSSRYSFSWLFDSEPGPGPVKLWSELIGPTTQSMLNCVQNYASCLILMELWIWQTFRVWWTLSYYSSCSLSLAGHLPLYLSICFWVRWALIRDQLSGRRSNQPENEEAWIVWSCLGPMNCLVQVSFWNVGHHGKPDVRSLRGRQQLGLERLGVLGDSLQWHSENSI